MASATEWVGSLMSDAEEVDCEDPDQADTMACSGANAYMRISFALLVFHLIMLVIMSCRTKMAAEFHDGCWCFKLLFVLGIYIASYWIENDPFFLGFYI